MHIIDTGYRFKGCPILVQTDKPGVTRLFRELMRREIFEPRNVILAPDLHPSDMWEDPLERKYARELAEKKSACQKV